MMSGADIEEPWFALSKDKYQTILNRALSEMEETPPALPPPPSSTIIANCSELIKLLNQDDELGSGSSRSSIGEPPPPSQRSSGTTPTREVRAATSTGQKRELDRTEKSSTVVIAEKISRRSSYLDAGRPKHRTSDHGVVRGSWRYPSSGYLPNRLPPEKANSRIDCDRDVQRKESKSVAFMRSSTKTVPENPQRTLVKLETDEYSCTESQTLDRIMSSLNRPNCTMTSSSSSSSSSSQNTNGGRCPLRIPRAFNHCSHDNGGKHGSAGATQCYTTRSSVSTEGSNLLNDLLSVEIDSIPDIDLKIPKLPAPGNNGLEGDGWRSSHRAASGKSEEVNGVTVKVENTSPVKRKPTQDCSSMLDTRQVDYTGDFDSVCFPIDDEVVHMSATELKKCPESWSNENVSSAEFIPLTDVMVRDWDVRHLSCEAQQDVSMQLRSSKFPTGMTGDLQRRHSRRFRDQPRSGSKHHSAEGGAETRASWPHRNPGCERSSIRPNGSQTNPVRLQAIPSQLDKDVVRVVNALQFETCFGEEPRQLPTGHDEKTAGQNAGVPSKRVQQLWAVVDKTVVSNMMEKILEKETNNKDNVDEKTTKSSSSQIERNQIIPFEIQPIPSEHSSLLACKIPDEAVENSTDFPLEWEPTQSNRQSTFLHSCEQLRTIVSDDVIGDVNECNYSGSERCPLNRSDVIALDDDDVIWEDSVRCDVNTLEAILLDDLKMRGGASTNDNRRSPSSVKVEPKLDAGNDAKAALNDVTRVNVSRMSFKWKSNILRRLRNDQMLAKKWCLSGTLLA